MPTTSTKQSESISFTGLGTPNADAQKVLDLVNRLETEQQADDAIFKAKAKKDAQDIEDTRQEQLLQIGSATVAKAATDNEIANKTKQVVSSLKADPTDPNSLMARNNQVITSLNEKLLTQMGVIQDIQNDDSLVGSIQRTINLAGYQQGAAVLKGMRDDFVNVNAELQQQVLNQTEQIKNVVTTEDVKFKMADGFAKAAEAHIKSASDGLMTMASLYSATHSAQQNAISATLDAGRFAQQSAEASIRLAIEKNQLAKIEDEDAMNVLVGEALGWTAGDFKKKMLLLKTDPYAYNAILHFAATGTTYLPSDAALIAQWQNKQGLINPDGTEKYALQFTSEYTRPAITARVNQMYADFTDYAVRVLGWSEPQVQKMLANPSLYKAELEKWQQKVPPKPAQVETVNMNPAVLESKGVILPPLITKYMESIPNKTLDVKAKDLIEQISASNPDARPQDLALELSNYFQQAVQLEQKRYIYQQIGLPAPTLATIPGAQIGAMARISRLSNIPFEAFTTGKVGTAGTGATGVPSIDITNQAQLEAHLQDLAFARRHK